MINSLHCDEKDIRLQDLNIELLKLIKKKVRNPILDQHLLLRIRQNGDELYSLVDLEINEKRF